MNATERLKARVAAAAARSMAASVRRAIAATDLPNQTGVAAHMDRLNVEMLLAIEELASAVDKLALLGSKSKGFCRVPVDALRPLAHAAAPAVPVAVPEGANPELPLGPHARTRHLRAPDGELSCRLSVAEQQRIARSAATDEPWRQRRSGGRR